MSLRQPPFGRAAQPLHEHREGGRGEQLAMEDALAHVGVAADELAAGRRQHHVLLRGVDETEKLRGLHGEDRVADLEPQLRSQLEEIDGVAVIVDDLEQTDDLADRHGRQGLHARRRRPARRPFDIGQVDAGDDGVDLVDEVEKRAVAVFARMAQRVLEHPPDRSRDSTPGSRCGRRGTPPPRSGE